MPILYLTNTKAGHASLGLRFYDTCPEGLTILKSFIVHDRKKFCSSLVLLGSVNIPSAAWTPLVCIYF